MIAKVISIITYILSVGIIIAIPITGFILLIDRFFFKTRREEKFSKMQATQQQSSLKSADEAQDEPATPPIPMLVAFASFLFPVVLFVGVLRSFIAETFVIPSGSMQPSLYAGDMIIANKWSFGLRYPLLNTRIFSKPGDGVNRGDIVIFRYPVDQKLNYIKRIVGLPGDVIDYKNKQLTINGEPLRYEFVRSAKEPVTDDLFTEFMLTRDGSTKEYLVQKSKYLTNADRGYGLKRSFPLTIPKDSYLVFGDNRDNSEDGRFWGFVRDDQLLGKANFIWMNYKCLTSFTDCDHIFTILH